MGVRFTFNCNNNWLQLLPFQTGSPPVTLLIQEGVTHRDPLPLVLYRINFNYLAEEIRSAYTRIITNFYAYNATFDVSFWRSAQL